LKLNDLNPDMTEAPAAILERAAERARSMGLHYAGAVTPAEAHRLSAAGAATIVDVRTPQEYREVGHVPETPLVVWPRGGGPDELQRFVEEIRERHEPGDTLLLLCRSGVRSHYAAHVLSQAGFDRAFNVLEGFEGAVPGQGWRAAGLPWTR
jgi:rhodanese-related sulfurtransferase